MAIQATLKVATDVDGHKEVDIKRYAKVEKIPGGDLEDCRVLNGVMFNKVRRHVNIVFRGWKMYGVCRMTTIQSSSVGMGGGVDMSRHACMHAP